MESIRWPQGNRVSWITGNIEDEIRQGNDIVTNASVSGKSQLLVFATPRAHGNYQGFEYDAIAIAYENADIVNVLDISAFNGNAQSYVVHSDGRVVNRSFFGVMGGRCIISLEC